MAITKSKRTGRYQSRFRDSTGKQQSFTSAKYFPQGTSKALAQKIDQKLISDIEAELNNDRIPTLEECVDRWLDDYAVHLKEPDNYRNHVKQLRHYIIGKSIEDVANVANAIKMDMLKNEYSANTIQKRLAILKRVAKLAFIEWEIIDVDLGARIKQPRPPKHRERFLSIEEVDLIAGNCRNSEVSDLLYFSAYTGIRFAELSRLHEGAIWNGRLTISQSKSGKTRAFKLSDEGVAVAERIQFPINIAYRTIQKYFKMACDESKLDDVKWHDLRHTFASWLAQSGNCNLQQLQQILGHSNINMTLKYAHLMPEHLEAAAIVLNEISDNKKLKNRHLKPVK